MISENSIHKKYCYDFDIYDLKRLYQSQEFVHLLCEYTWRSIYYRKYVLQITQPSQYRYTQLQYRFALIYEAPSILDIISISIV